MSSLPPPAQHGAIALLEKRFNTKVSLLQFQLIGGGCINSGGRLHTSIGDFFVKWNDLKNLPGMFDAEKKGLTLLRKVHAIDIPEVIGNGEIDHLQFIVLEFIEGALRSDDFWKKLGTELALLHGHTGHIAGLDHDNYMGSLQQRNKQHVSWVDFFIEQRLKIQVELAVNSRIMEKSLVNKFEDLYRKLPHILAIETPSLLHGDLWNGNLLVNKKGEPCLIDPAVYFGHREVDLAMTQLFGGFDDSFFNAYIEAFPLQPGYRERFDIYNLYPLLVHVNLFGKTYLPQVNHILKEFN